MLSVKYHSDRNEYAEFTMMMDKYPQQELERLENRAKTVSKIIQFTIMVALILFVGGAMAGFYGFAKAIAYIGALGWFLLEWLRSNLLDRVNAQYRKELECLTRRVENYENQIRIEKIFVKKSVKN